MSETPLWDFVDAVLERCEAVEDVTVDIEYLDTSGEYHGEPVTDFYAVRVYAEDQLRGRGDVPVGEFDESSVFSRY